MSQSNEARAPRRFQFSLLMLLVLTGWAAIVCLALKTPTPPWAAGVFLLTMLATLAAGLGILYRTGQARVFMVGFFAGSLSYAACLFITERYFGGQFPNDGAMPTTTFANWLFDRLHPESASMVGGMMGGGMGGMGGSGMGGGGFFSVDSSLDASQGAAGDPDTAGGGDVQGVPANGDSADGSSGNALDSGSGDMGGMGTPGMPGAAGMPGAGGPAAPVTPTIYFFKQFAVIVHSALAMLMGLAGGVIAQLFYAAKRESAVQQAPVT